MVKIGAGQIDQLNVLGSSLAKEISKINDLSILDDGYQEAIASVPKIFEKATEIAADITGYEREKIRGILESGDQQKIIDFFGKGKI